MKLNTSNHRLKSHGHPVPQGFCPYRPVNRDRWLNPMPTRQGYLFSLWPFITWQTSCWSVLDFWKIKFEKSSSTNWIFSLQKSILKLIFAGYTGSKNQVRNRLKIQFVELDFSKLIFQKSSTDQQGVRAIAGNFYGPQVRTLQSITYHSLNAGPEMSIINRI